MVLLPRTQGKPCQRKPEAPTSLDIAAFLGVHPDALSQVGEITLDKAINTQEPWAIRLCMQLFYPKPGTRMTASQETKRKDKADLNLKALSPEDRETFLTLWGKFKVAAEQSDKQAGYQPEQKGQ